MLTENQRAFFEAALASRDLRTYIQTWWDLYDILRTRGELPKIDPGNPHTSTDVFTLAGYVFSNRDALAELDKMGIEAIVEKLSGGEIENPWQP